MLSKPVRIVKFYLLKPSLYYRPPSKRIVDDGNKLANVQIMYVHAKKTGLNHSIVCLELPLYYRPPPTSARRGDAKPDTLLRPSFPRPVYANGSLCQSRLSVIKSQSRAFPLEDVSSEPL